VGFVPRSSKLLRAFVPALVIACAAPAASAAAPADEVLSAGQAVARGCDARLFAPGTPGVARSSWTAPARGLVTVSLSGGPEGDWDLAAFRRPGSAAVAASSAFGSDEQLTVAVNPGDRLDLQACRRSGDGPDSVLLGFDLYEMDAAAPANPRISVESVPISEPQELDRLERLGFDVTHDVSQDAATVVLYTARERARLATAGFSATTLIPDLAAEDAADRRSEGLSARVAASSALPSGRETYRVYNDYTSRMKALAENNPRLVRPVVLGRTFEDRPIQGVEIATDVKRTDDGRPVYLNFGLHHAREWPSGELPMEFALDLVRRFRDENPRVTALLERVRVIIVPVINVDGFIASRSYGTSPADNNSLATLPFAINDQAAYKRKNCRPTVPSSAAMPCARRSNSGVDLNRNYGAYWGGSGSTSDRTAQSYRGTGPYSEPESQAVRVFTAGLHPTVFITNHTFTADGKWLRQPGFDDVIKVTPDEPAMKDLGDDMAGATGWTSELGYETLGDITGATEDWNYFSQGTYGYTPEIRGTNFHANYADSVVEEYVGDAQHRGLGVREAFLIAGERAANTADHSIIAGTAPPRATLRLRKEFDTVTSQKDVVVDDVLNTRLTVPADGRYRWHVNPSGRPLHPGERWTMSCRLPGGGGASEKVSVDRGERVQVNWAGACGGDGGSAPPGTSGPLCMGTEVTIAGTPRSERLVGTAGRDVFFARRGDDRVVGRGGGDVICTGRGADTARGARGRDSIAGWRGPDRLRGGPGRDDLLGGPGKDRLGGGRGRDHCRGGRGADTARSCP